MSLNIGILTSTDIRHRYFVNAIAEHHKVVAVGYQNTGYRPADTAQDRIDAETAQVVQRHFAERDRQERAYFGHNAEPRADGDTCRVASLDPATLNTDKTADSLAECDVDVLLVYGTGVIKPPLLSRFAGRTINMHLGLSPYYRGTATNFYPLLNEEPQFVGATIHMIDPGIDTGPIIHHARPEITADDMPHTVGCKAILAGIEKLSQALDEFQVGNLVTVPQWPVENAKVYLRQHYHPSQVVRLYELIAAGLFPNYVARKDRVQDAFRLVP
ncbi:MAG: formyl transferase [Phycisphaerae bacterium]